MLDDPVVADRLRADEVIWLTTVDEEGQPQSSAVWFHWDGTDVLVLSQPRAGKVANIGGNARVSLHLEGGQAGSVVVTIEGRGRLADADRPRLAAYCDKYADGFTRLGTDAAAYLAQFSASIVVTPTRARVFPSV